jgi:hypothetical protein
MKRLNGGFVTITSDSFNISIHSEDLKSPLGNGLLLNILNNCLFCFKNVF